MTQTITRALRFPLAWLLIAALAVLMLLALERTAPTTSPSLLKSATSQSAPAAKPAAQPAPKHCTDGKGKDNTKNKNCISHG